MRNAKIVCTLGPASSDRETIHRLAEAGMSVARLNASHGDTEDRAALIERLRTVDEERDRPIAIMLDLQGPEIRTAPLDEGETITLETGQTVQLAEGTAVTTDRIGVSEPLDGVSAGDRILLDDGLIELDVIDVAGEGVETRVESGGELGSRKGVNVPGVDLDLETITAGDRAELELAAEYDVDFVAASFVRDADDVYAVNEVLEGLDADVPIISKIERADAVDNLDELVDASAGIMVARGDLGVELPMEDVPMIQKRIIRRGHEGGVPVITATEMLDSMVHSRRPTRAEASDVANAVLDGTDAVMLSAETAVGDHPVRVVETMDRIVREVERSGEYDTVLEGRVPKSGSTRTDALARAARYLARDVDADAIVAATESGYTARKAAKYRPAIPIVASTPHEDVRRELALSWGVTPVYAPVGNQGVDAVIERAVQSALDAGVAESGDTVVVLCGMMTELEGANTTNMLKVHVAADTIETGRVVVEGRASGPIAHAPEGDLTDVPDGAIVAIDAIDEFTGDVSKLAGIVDTRPGMTGYAALVARELGIPMLSDADCTTVEAGRIVTIDGDRGVVYDGDVGTDGSER
ncbi:pyruvate kinase [Halovivax ruber XH-70]|uniref:Pyruvate kinase n=1 Tax=Halovivax ruber (strain DSM 18193 / JCM 13892 / XH-70) TaxID=797302 RepID=L0I815_HALRX|nr:pyruvate kinase [Halovivax ruber]AGB15735.1 pyruvate kinase [Halovivax ruber XH-70]